MAGALHRGAVRVTALVRQPRVSVCPITQRARHTPLPPMYCASASQQPPASAASTSAPAASASGNSADSDSGSGSGLSPPPPRQPGDPADLASLVRQLDVLLEAAADEGGEGPAARRAEADATKLASRGRELGLLRGYGCGRQVPKRIYTLEELRLNRVEAEKLLSPNDTSLNSVRTIAQAAAAAGLLAAAYLNQWEAQQVLMAVFGAVFTLTADQVANGGGGEALFVDSLGRLLRPSYGSRVAYHEAGHLLVAYLVGLLPRAYTLSSLDAFLKYRALNIQAGTRFCDSEFSAEVTGGRLKASSLERYTCVALAGVVTEYLRFDVAEGGLGDVQQLDAMFRALGFTQKKADGEVRWAVLNCASLLRRHERLHDELAAAMRRGSSVGQCVELIEQRLATCDDV